MQDNVRELFEHAGGSQRVVCLNHAATTPPFRPTLTAVARFLENYGALHRGAGPRARATCEAVESAIAVIRNFIGCTERHALLFTGNSSSAINMLARLLPLESSDIVLISEIEHTSNNLPWRYNTPAQVLEVAADESGSLVIEHLERMLRKYGSRVKVVSITGASNLSGAIPDLAVISRMTVAAGALFVVDAAQLVPHRPISMQASGIDALVFSGHKVYAPFGLGVLAVPQSYLNRSPVDPAGGSIDMLSSRGVLWAPPAERHQAGTWNTVGIIALAESIRVLQQLGWPRLCMHEAAVVQEILEGLERIDRCKLYVPPQRYFAEDRIGTIPFNLAGIHPALLASALEHEYAIEVRAGTICNHRLVARWLNVDSGEQTFVEQEIARGNRLASYGVVRASVGQQNTIDDARYFVHAVQEIAERGTRISYRPRTDGEGFEPLPASSKANAAYSNTAAW